jgi:hypothetical protein
MTDKPTRGGPRPGAGRPPLDPNERAVNITVRVPESWAHLIRAKRLRPAIRNAIARIVKPYQD